MTRKYPAPFSRCISVLVLHFIYQIINKCKCNWWRSWSAAVGIKSNIIYFSILFFYLFVNSWSYFKMFWKETFECSIKITPPPPCVPAGVILMTQTTRWKTIDDFDYWLNRLLNTWPRPLCLWGQNWTRVLGREYERHLWPPLTSHWPIFWLL